MSDDVALLQVLRVIQASDDSGSPANNASIASALGFDLELVANVLADAKERSLVWGQRSGEKPAPWFNELEVTVQGRRLLRTSDDA
jgi:hypothetical protein